MAYELGYFNPRILAAIKSWPVDNAAGGALNLLGALNSTASTLTLTAATTEKPILQLELEAAARRARDDDAANFVDI